MHKHRLAQRFKTKEPRLISKVTSTFKDYRPLQSDLNQTIEEFYISLDTPISLSCLILFRHGEYDQLVRKEIDPLVYNDPFLFRDDFAAINFLRKSKFLKLELDVREEALKTFREAENLCEVTNKRFRDLTSDQFYFGQNARILSNMSRKIVSILGAFDVNELLDEASWGPGVTRLVKGAELSGSRKFSDENGITRNAYRLLGDICEKAYPHWLVWKPNRQVFFEGNQVITVPKSAKTDRTIAIEPGLNSWFQKGMGKIIRRRLRKHGFDLNSDLKNQRSAYRGSIDNSLATVDFSSASDTIAYNLVLELIPHPWFAILDSLRSPCFSLEGKTFPYQKFSAMGNGFTFELESLIFVSAALAVCDELGLDKSQVSVFGDDIILPSQAFNLYVDFCKFLGFIINKKKSYSSGYFRESCGAYYFDGVDVKPLYLKEFPRNAKGIFRLANSLRLFAHRRNNYYGCDNKFLAVWKYLIRRLPKDLRIFGSVDSGDFSVHVNFDEACPVKPGGQLEGWFHPALISSPVQRARDDFGLLLNRLKSPSTSMALGNQDPLRGATKTRFRKRFFVRQWYNFGPWY